jgi:CHASE3 domain sensor protein
MNWSAGKTIIIGAVLLLLLLSGVNAISYRTGESLFESIGWVDRTHRALEDLDEPLNLLTRAESAQRAYLITGKESYLIPYIDATNTLREAMVQLRGEITDTTQAQHLRDLARLALARQTQLDELLALRRTQGPQAAVRVLQTEREKDLMEHLRQLTRLMTDHELTLLDQRAADRAASLRRAVIFIISASLFAVVLTGVAGLLIYHDLAERQIAAEKLKASALQLEQTNRELSAALLSVKTLSGLLPICSHCKKIRDDRGYWNQIETYISDHSEAGFTHSICPECARTLYPDLYKKEG